MSAWIHVSGEDDWEGVYVNGTLAEQNHSVDWAYLLEKQTLPTSFVRFTVSDDYLCEEGQLPKKFADIPEDMLEAM